MINICDADSVPRCTRRGTDRSSTRHPCSSSCGAISNQCRTTMAIERYANTVCTGVVPPSSRGREATRTSSARANQRAQAHALISVPRRRGRYSPARRISLGRFDRALRITNVGSDDSTIATPDSGERPLAARASKSVELRPPRRSRSCRGQQRQQAEPSAHRSFAFAQVVTMLEGAPVVVRIPLGKGIASSRSAGGCTMPGLASLYRERVSRAQARGSAPRRGRRPGP